MVINSKEMSSEALDRLLMLIQATSL